MRIFCSCVHDRKADRCRSDQLRKQYDVNVFGLLDVTTAFLPYMRAQRAGTVVLMGSRTSWWPENPVSHGLLVPRGTRC